ncbi:MAG: DUF4249 family protein [Candidatus Coatesbacteria bacterium]|nr:DUF4249 family protein [Candidatus Coatesbacteria bacterium]
MKEYLLVALVVFCFCSCQTTDEQFQQQLVVSSFLKSRHETTDLKLNYAEQIGEKLDETGLGVSGANVLFKHGNEKCRLNEEKPGLYIYRGVQFTANETCYLEIKIDTFFITSRTVIPDTLKLLGTYPDTITIYDNINLSWFPSKYHSGYLVSIKNLEDPDKREAIDEDYEEFTREGRSDVQSYLIDKNVTKFNLTSIEFMWYGKHRISVKAIDRNYFDFMRSAEEQSNIEPICHINGCLGVFGSYSEDSIYLYLKKEEK